MATQKVFCKYQEIIDLNTVGGTVSVIGIHTPTGNTPRKMFPGFFQQYKKWKYLGCSVVGANAAQLPVDPLGVSYEAGEGNDTVADPRDVLNPILFHGCHGEDLGPILNSLYCQNSANDLTDSLTGFNEDASNSSDFGRSELVEGLYYKALTDATWKKFGIQSGIRLNRLHPLVYSMATNHYISPSNLGGELTINANGAVVVADGKVPDIDGLLAVGSRDTRFFTPRLTGLGWMETRLPYVASSNLPNTLSDDEYSDWQSQLQAVKNYATMPKIFMGVLLLPPSYRIKQFMRIVITHRFAFAGFRGASFADNVLGSPSFFEAPDLDFSDGSNDDSMLGNDGGSGTDPDDPGSGGGNDGPLEGDSMNVKVTNALNNSVVFLVRTYNSSHQFNESSEQRYKCAYNESYSFTVPLGSDVGVVVKVKNYNTSYSSVDDSYYAWADATAIGWHVNSSEGSSVYVSQEDGYNFDGTYNNLSNPATQS